MRLEHRMRVAVCLVDSVGEYVYGSHRDLPIDVELLDFTRHTATRMRCSSRISESSTSLLHFVFFVFFVIPVKCA